MTTDILTTVVGSFANRTEAQDAVRALRSAGFPDGDIGVVGKRMEYHGEATSHSGLPNDPTHSRWEEGTGVGAAAGAVTGTGLGLAVVAGLIPGVGPVIAGGALMALLASAGAGATVGTVVGGLIGLGVPEDEADYYEDEVSSGRVLVSVDAGDRREEATDILRRHGASFHRLPTRGYTGLSGSRSARVAHTVAAGNSVASRAAKSSTPGRSLA